ncbi:MAG: hypothetical protein HPY51_02070 [Candidatus Omnitrophica bacterium]|nr:hypothetical protein [Candidatus Omnitrophota bacterium]
MSDIRKKRDKVFIKKSLDYAKTDPPSTEAPPSPAAPADSRQEIPRGALFRRGFLYALGAFATGVLMTTMAVSFANLASLPHRGLTQLKQDGTSEFVPYYPKMRPFAIVEDDSQAGNESQFTRLGLLGTGLFFYTVLNTFHWTLELGLSMIGGMLLIPLFVLTVYGYVFYFKIFPPALRRDSNILMLGSGIGLCHAGIVLLVWILGSFVWPVYGSLFGPPYFYSGAEIPVRVTAVPIMLLTGFTYGAITGGILYFVAVLRSLFLGSPRPAAASKFREGQRTLAP